MADLTDLFVRSCRSLYGDNWQTAASRDLEMADRHVRRLAKGEVPVRAGMLIDLWRLMLDRQLEIDKIIDEIKVVAGRQDVDDDPHD